MRAVPPPAARSLLHGGGPVAAPRRWPDGPSARGAGAALVVDVEGDGEQQDEALDDRLYRLVYTLQLHAVAQHRDEQAPVLGADAGADTAGDGRAPHEGRRGGL